MVKSPKTAKLLLDGKEYDLPVMSPTAGPDVIDIESFTMKLGFLHTILVSRRLLVVIVQLLSSMVERVNYYTEVTQLINLQNIHTI